MARLLRSQTVNPEKTCLYHTGDGCAQHLALFADEDDACKTEICVVLRRLHQNSAIELVDHNLMDNHYHLIVRLDPEAVKDWSDEEVIRRWFASRGPSGQRLTEARLKSLLKDKAWIEQHRQALGSISQFMKDFKQCMTQWINRYLGTSGTAWEGRYYSGGIETIEQLIRACAYVNLNPVAAGICDLPEEAVFSSAFERHARLEAQEQGHARPSRFHTLIGLPPMGDADFRTAQREAWEADGHGLGRVIGRSHRGQPLIPGASDRAWLELLGHLACSIREGSERAVETTRQNVRCFGVDVAALAAQLRAMFEDPRWAPV